MEIDERENDVDLLQELKRSRLRLKYNWENLFKKYENITESGIEVQLDTFEVYAPVGMNRKTVVKEVEKHEFLGSQFGASVFSAPGNEDSLEGCHPKIVEKCRKMDKEFSKINELLSVVPHRQKLIRGPNRGRKFFIRKTIREDVVKINPEVQRAGFIALDAGMSDGPIPTPAFEAIESNDNVVSCNLALVNSTVPNLESNMSLLQSESFMLNNGLSDGPLIPRLQAPMFVTDGLSDGPIVTSPKSPFLMLENCPSDNSNLAPSESAPVMINDGLIDGPISLTQLYYNQPSTSEENHQSEDEISENDESENTATTSITEEESIEQEGKKTAAKRFSSENIENEVETKKLKKEEETQSVDGLVLDLSMEQSGFNTSTDQFWTSSQSCKSIVSEVTENQSKAYSLCGVPLTIIDSEQSLLTNWARNSVDGIENVMDGQDYVSREERRLICSARRRNSYLARGSVM